MSSSKYLSRRQILLDFIRDYLAENNFPPSANQLSRRLGWSLSVCQGYLKRLRAEIPLPPLLPRKYRRFRFYRQQLLEAIQDYLAQHGFPPSLRNLASMMDLSPNTLRRYLAYLRSEGLIDYTPGIPRSLHLIK